MDLSVTLLVLAVMGTVSVPPIATHRGQALRVGCINNLRQVGHGLRVWASDHNDSYPPLVAVQDGGTRQHPLGLNVWVHYTVASNELRNARILACPADPESRKARDFSASRDVGLMHPDLRDKAISYFIAHPYPDFPKHILAGDRNLTPNLTGAGCSYFPSSASLNSFSTLWDFRIHHRVGNILAADGSVEGLSSLGLRLYLRNGGDDNDVFHFLPSR